MVWWVTVFVTIACQQGETKNDKVRGGNSDETWIERNRQVDRMREVDFVFNRYNWIGESLELNLKLRNRSNSTIILTETASSQGEKVFGNGESLLVKMEGVWWRSLEEGNDYALMVREVVPGESVEILLDLSYPREFLSRADEIKIEYCGFVSESFKVSKR